MTRNEQEIFDNIRTGSNKYYVPLVWATTLISRARKEDRIHTDYAKVYLLQVKYYLLLADIVSKSYQW